MKHTFELPINEEKVIDKVIDVYLWISEDLNTAEVLSLATHLTNLANRRATDIEAYYQSNSYPEECYPTIEDIINCEEI